MSLLALAYPNISDKDYQWIQEFREENDELYYGRMEPHFPLVFPVYNQRPETFIEEIKTRSSNHQRIEFTIRCAVMEKDAFTPYWHVLMVPDEGYSRLVKLHDDLYSGKLAEELRMDRPFIPHIGIANSIEQWKCKELVDQINHANLEIMGTINEINVVEYHEEHAETLEKIKLTSNR
ncbi:MAG: hypothetical protein PWQ15_1677 [Methanobacterium sp.]|jgi:2'-5' RNA ligase|uniref:2'-5' RNA ligase family protein n=1 Tax=Methanobacterium sp. TaxID=2164 RepID=UPI0003C9CBD9|nr:2'-5' RNA ligase family protein [Methanobacterium sp.]MDI3550574.1 hypothetical protein [Methanobacterium sp.]CDG64738.1 hypothetical protein MBMB1_0631 [Methanobacterium sp. MB1]